MIKCNATGRRCHVMTIVLEQKLPVTSRGIMCSEEGVVLYRVKAPHFIAYVMPYCPWCGARLRMTPAQREEEKTKRLLKTRPF